jgi:GNAT superfamily N-acetyltransferase
MIERVSIELRRVTPADLPAARALLATACDYDDAAGVAEEKLFGAAPADAASSAFAAVEGADLVGVAVASSRWIRLLAVAPATRHRGIGTALLAAAESVIIGTTARTMDQPGNYLAPGVDVRNQDTIGWLERRGYQPIAENTNLVIELAGNQRVSQERAADMAVRAGENGYRVRRAGPADRAALAATVELAFGRAWAFEVDRALGGDPPAVHLALDADGAIAAFAAHDGNNRGLGWFGPAGTLMPHRGKGLGEALLVACLVDLAGEGRQSCTVAWIGPRDFYQRAAGIAREDRFVVLGKELDRP